MNSVPGTLPETLRKWLRKLFPWLFPPKYDLSLACDREAGYEGDTFRFYGYFKEDGKPVRGAIVSLYRDGVKVKQTQTGSGGEYVIPWVADVVGSFTFYAESVGGSEGGYRVRSPAIRVGWEK